MDNAPSAYYQPDDELAAAIPGRIVIDGSHEYDYYESEISEIDDAAPTLRAVEIG